MFLSICQGPITRDELREILQQPGEEALTDEEIDEIFLLIDLNADNEISVDGNYYCFTLFCYSTRDSLQLPPIGYMLISESCMSFSI